MTFAKPSAHVTSPQWQALQPDSSFSERFVRGEAKAAAGRRCDYRGWAQRLTHACIAIPAATPALMERVEPNCAIEQTASAPARPRRSSPGPSWPKRSSACAAGRTSRAARRRAGCRRRRSCSRPRARTSRSSAAVARAGRAGSGRSPWRRAGSSAGCRRSIDLAGEERVGGAHDGADVEVVAPVLDRDGEVVAAGVEVGDDRLDRPVPVAVDDVAAVAVTQQLRVEPRVVGPGQRMRPDADLGEVVGRASVTDAVLRPVGQHRVEVLGVPRRWRAGR